MPIMTFPYQLIDLTHTLDSSVPTWNGGCGFNHEIHLDYPDCQGTDKFRVMQINMHAGIGTHIDAPSHCFVDGKAIDNFELDDLCMPGFIIDVSDKAHENYSLTSEDIIAFEATHGVIPQNSCVIVKTGWEKFWNHPEKYRNNHVFPCVSPEAASLLLERNIAALGIDTLSPDRPENGFPVHRLLLGAGKILIENAAHLDNMPPKGAYVMILPMKIKNGTEAPIRLVGLLEK